MMIKRTLLLVFVALVSGAAPLLAAGGPPAKVQYIVVLRPLDRGAPQPAEPVEAVVARGGGTIDFRRSDRIVVSIPETAAGALKAHPGVKYLQKVTTGPDSRTPEDAAALPSAAEAMPEQPENAASARRAASLRPLAVTTPPTWSSGTYVYDGSGNIAAVGADSFLYDGVMRLTDARVSGHHEAYTYDGFGNMTSKTTDNAAMPIAVTPSTNRLSTYNYDAAGNVTGLSTLPVAQYSYDPFNLMRDKYEPSTNGTEMYIYSADDERIGVVSNQDKVTWSVRDPDGKVLRQYQSDYNSALMPWLWVEDYVYRDAQMLASQRPVEEGGRRQFHLDHLGTPRLITSPDGSMSSLHDYYPFGTEITPLRQDVAGGYDREEPKKFTGHERDFTVGTSSENTNYLDYMHARYYGATFGRFLSVDPIIGDRLRPQSWNRYAYVDSSPLTHTDPTGLATARAILPPVSPTNALYFEYGLGEKDKFLSELARLDGMIANGTLPPNLAVLLKPGAPSFLAAGLLALNGGARLPDYVTVAVNVAIPNKITATLAGPTGQLTFDRYGRIYFTLAVGVGKSMTTVSYSVTGGWLRQKQKPTAAQLYNFISGWGGNVALGYVGGAGLTWGGPGQGFSNEVGGFSPQAGFSGGYTWQIPVQGYTW